MPDLSVDNTKERLLAALNEIQLALDEAAGFLASMDRSTVAEMFAHSAPPDPTTTRIIALRDAAEKVHNLFAFGLATYQVERAERDLEIAKQLQDKYKRGI